MLKERDSTQTEENWKEFKTVTINKVSILFHQFHLVQWTPICTRCSDIKLSIHVCSRHSTHFSQSMINRMYELVKQRCIWFISPNHNRNPLEIHWRMIFLESRQFCNKQNNNIKMIKVMSKPESNVKTLWVLINPKSSEPPESSETVIRIYIYFFQSTVKLAPSQTFFWLVTQSLLPNVRGYSQIYKYKYLHTVS